MYSKNDYRYYLENHLMHSDDFFAHYGVKGMKWKHHKSPKLGLSELNKMQKADLDAFYSHDSKEAEAHLKDYRKAEKAYNKTLLGKADKKTKGLATAPIRIHQQRKRRKAEERHREYEKWRKTQGAGKENNVTKKKRKGPSVGHNTVIL